VAGSNNEAKIRFKAETDEFTSAIKDANSEMSTLRAEMKLNEAQFQNTGNETEYLQQKSSLLEAQLEANAQKQEALTEKLNVAKDIYGEDSEEVARLERQLINAQTEEEKLKTQLDNVNQSMEGQSQAADEAGSAVDNMAEILVNAGIASTIKEIGDAVYDMAGSFDEANAAIVEGTGATGDALEELNQTARSAFSQIADSGQDIDGVANILAELNTRFGVTGEEAEDLTVKVANFAHHTGTDGTRAVDSIANVMNRWGMDISEADGLLDDLTTANQACQLSVDEMTRYLSDNSIQFQELGYSTSDALAMLISLSDGGANVSSVMSGMKKAVGNLSAVTDDVPGAFQDAITAIAECDNVSEALQAQVGDTGLTVEQVFGAKAAQELAANVQNGNFAIDQWTEALENNSGALEQTTDDATTMQDAWAQATNSMSVALGGTLASAVSDVVTVIADMISSMAIVIQDSPALQAVITGVATALGILAGALAISSLIQAVQKAFALLNTTMLANPIFLVITAIAALVAGLVYAYNHCEEFRRIVDEAFNMIKTVVVTVIETVMNTISTAFTAIVAFFSNTWNNAKNIVTTVWNAIKTAISTAVNTVRNTISTVFTAIRTVTQTVWNAIKTAITTPVNAARSTVTSVFNGIRSTVSSVVNGIKSTVSSTFNAIKTAMTSPIESAKSTISGILGKIKGMFPMSIGRVFSNLSLPHISVSGGSAPFGIGGKGSLPKFSVSWHAKGVIFDAPTLIPTLNGVHGVAEAGPEAVSPISVLQDYVGAAVKKHMPQPIDYDKLGNKIAEAVAMVQPSIKVNGRELGRIVREVM